MKIVIFGLGEIFRRNKDYIAKEDEIVAFIDNNTKMHGKRIDGTKIYSPNELKEIIYDKVLIMSNFVNEMKSQLLKLGCIEENILFYPEYISNQQEGRMEIYFGKKEWEVVKKGIVITSSLNYHGGAIVAAYTALELQKKGYKMTIAAPNGNEQFIREFQKKGITFLLYPNLQFAKIKELFWIWEFQIIIVNTYPMIMCALEIGMYRKVIVWLHESDAVYHSMDFWKDLIVKRIPNDNLSLYAVSDVAKNNFEKNVKKCNIGIFPYGIPDARKESVKINKNLRFAVVGTIFPIKFQLLFLDAIEILNRKEYLENQFLIIGDQEIDPGYVRKVKDRAKLFSNVIIKGRLTRNEIEQLYKEIDVFVISSEEETMSLVATEAMMYGKVCILCNVAGMAKYIRHGENGLLFQTGDANDLAQQMKFCIDNKELLFEIGRNARITYEKCFTMKNFGDNLERILSRDKEELYS